MERIINQQRGWRKNVKDEEQYGVYMNLLG